MTICFSKQRNSIRLSWWLYDKLMRSRPATQTR